MLSFGWVVGIKKCFERWGVEGLVELLRDVMKHVVIEERLMEPLMKKWEDPIKTKLEYYIANINPEC